MKANIEERENYFYSQSLRIITHLLKLEMKVSAFILWTFFSNMAAAS